MCHALSPSRPTRMPLASDKLKMDFYQQWLSYHHSSMLVISHLRCESLQLLQSVNMGFIGCFYDLHSPGQACQFRCLMVLVGLLFCHSLFIFR